MKERTLVVFTLLVHISVGSFMVLTALVYCGFAELVSSQAWWIVCGLMVLALVISFFHLGSPFKAWKVLSNFRTSWLSREILFALVFTIMCGLTAIWFWFERPASATYTIITIFSAHVGAGLIHCMIKIYRLRTVSVWDTWLTHASFHTTSFLLGGLFTTALITTGPQAASTLQSIALQVIVNGIRLVLVLQIILVVLWLRYQKTQLSRPYPARFRITSRDRSLITFRLVLLFLCFIAFGLGFSCGRTWVVPTTLGTFGLTLISEIAGRVLFYESSLQQKL